MASMSVLIVFRGNNIGISAVTAELLTPPAGPSIDAATSITHIDGCGSSALHPGLVPTRR
ncbi:hypothetical protein ABH922_001610 [Rhodococcus sp. 27YEA15]